MPGGGIGGLDCAAGAGRSRDQTMPYQCFYTGKRTRFGKSRRYKGQRIQKGGFGLKPTGISRRTFRPNLQKVRAVVEGSPQRIRVSTAAIRSGLVVKPLRRKFGYTRQQKAAGSGQ